MKNSDQSPLLLVDDSENDLLLMRVAFEKAEFTRPILEVHNGEEAIDYLNGIRPYDDRAKFPLPAVMLLDLNMPKKNGFDVLAWIRANPTCKRLTVIILTASMRMEDVERAFELGANSFLVKPTTVHGLVAMMRCLRDWLSYNHFPPLNVSVQR
jgi:CheY-like chemotaxis protein